MSCKHDRIAIDESNPGWIGTRPIKNGRCLECGEDVILAERRDWIGSDLVEEEAGLWERNKDGIAVTYRGERE